MGKRLLSQIIASVAMNANFQGFFQGQIYKGDAKKICVPVLNCYSCPGALGACPIGALQAVAGSVVYKVSLYVVGFLCVTGILLGRFFCGWLCPFGFIQELLNKIPGRKIRTNLKADKLFRYLKYVMLGLLVLILPALFADQFGLSTPYFCEFICPAGTLEGGIPLVWMNEPLQSAIGWLFTWKMIILIVIIVLSILIYRPFCKYVCPLGAFYSVFNRISFYRYEIDPVKCTHCQACTKACRMNVDVLKNPNNSECIRCGNCIEVCPSKAIAGGFCICHIERLSWTKYN